MFEVQNQPPPLEPYNLFVSDVRRNCVPWIATVTALTRSNFIPHGTNCLGSRSDLACIPVHGRIRSAVLTSRGQVAPTCLGRSRAASIAR